MSNENEDAGTENKDQDTGQKGADDKGTINYDKSDHAEDKDSKSADGEEKKDTLLTGKDSDKANDADDKDASKDADKSDADGNKDTPGEYGEFSIPEGTELDKSAMEAFTPVAKELGLTQDQAQKLVDVYSKADADSQAALTEQVDALHQSWIQEVKDDADLGGVKFDETIATARTFMNGYGDKELTDVMNETGLGNHPAVVRLFYKLGRSMAEDNVNIGAVRGQEGEVSLAKKMFPNMA